MSNYKDDSCDFSLSINTSNFFGDAFIKNVNTFSNDNLKFLSTVLFNQKELFSKIKRVSDIMLDLIDDYEDDYPIELTLKYALHHYLKDKRN